jgi:imidazolonepropionase-like amidohydrolase
MFRNVRIFNGTDPALSEPSDVTVTGNLITQIRPTAVNPAPQPSQQVLDGTGKTLIPGLIDAHVHLMFAALAPQDAFTADESYIHIAAAWPPRRTPISSPSRGPATPITPRSASSPPEPSPTLSSSTATHCRTST